jgi:hypothetical protein
MERDMTSDEMARFEEDTLHGEGERNRGDRGPASEQDQPWAPQQPQSEDPPAPIPNPD